MLLLVLVQEVFKVSMNGVQESVDFFEGFLGELFDTIDSLTYHGGQFLPFIRVLLLVQIEAVEQDLASLDQLFMGQLKVLVLWLHLEV